MMKWLTRFFISLFIFLLSGYGQMYAATYRDCLCDIQINPDKPIHSIFNTAKKCDASSVITPALSRTDKVNDKIDPSDNEDEDDKPISFKKQLEVNKYFIAAFSLQTPALFSYHTKQRLTLNGPSVYFITHKWYILFRVIRI